MTDDWSRIEVDLLITRMLIVCLFVCCSVS